MAPEKMIPRIIHSMWYDANEYDNLGPPPKYPRYHEYDQQWHNLHPTWHHQFWNRRRVEALWKDPRLSRWRQFFDSLARLIEKCDFSRYAILWLYGGVYRDLDMVPVQPLDTLIATREFGWSYEPQNHVNHDNPNHRYITNAFLCSTPGHWIWPQLMDFIQQHYSESKNPVQTTGPAIIAKCAHEFNLSSQYPEYFIDTCRIIPLDKFEQISPECPQDAVRKAYCYTRWNEGTNWDIQNKMLLSIMTHKNLILTITLVIIIVVLIVGFTYLT
jgi:mannosyltransferase OCH1-like enzyme